MSTLHGSLLPFFKLRLSWGATQLETGFRRSSNTNGRVGPDDTITLFSMNTSANMFGWGCVCGGCSAGQAPRLLCKMRWCKQADWLSLLNVSSLRFHAGWIYRESQCIGICLGLLWGQYQRDGTELWTSDGKPNINLYIKKKRRIHFTIFKIESIFLLCLSHWSTSSAFVFMLPIFYTVFPLFFITF